MRGLCRTRAHLGALDRLGDLAQVSLVEREACGRQPGIELAGPVTALARVQCSIGPKLFTDFLSLIHVDGRWQIISKVFHLDLRA